MTGGDFLAVAKQLAAGGTEAEWRSAISRAYYAAIHVARELLEDLRSTVPHADRAHAYHSRRLANCGQARIQQGGAGFNALRGDRNQADNNLDRSVTAQLAALHVQVAEQIVQSLQDVLREPVRSQVTIDKGFLIAKPMGKPDWTKPRDLPRTLPPSRGEAASSNCHAKPRAKCPQGTDVEAVKF
jgi:hypothetical protein